MNIKNNKNHNLIPTILKNIRFELNLTQAELAKKVGLSVGSIFKYENNQMDPTYRSIGKIKEFCEDSGINWDDLKNIKNKISNDSKEDNYVIEIQKKYIKKLEDEISELNSSINDISKPSTKIDSININKKLKEKRIPKILEGPVSLNMIKEDESVRALAFRIFKESFYYRFEQKGLDASKIDDLFMACCLKASQLYPKDQIGPLFYQVAHHILTKTSIEDQGEI